MPSTKGRASKRQKVNDKRNKEQPRLQLPTNVSIGQTRGALFDSGEIARRLLTLHESEYWSSSLGAKFAAAQYKPGNVCRRLGTITRILTGNKQHTVEELAKISKPTGRCLNNGVAPGKRNNTGAPSKSVITTFVKKHMQSSDQHSARLQSIRNAGTFTPCWSERTGEVLWNNGGNNDVKNIINNENSKSSAILSCTAIENLFKKKDLRDPQPQRTCEFYNGLKSIKVDTVSVLEALLDLATPVDTLWSQPMIVTIPILETYSDNKNNQNNSSSSSTSFRLTIGVYVNRMLFECTTRNLEVVMAALDQGSFQIDRPLAPAPSLEGNPPAVFESDPWPKVVFDNDVDVDDDNSLASDADPERDVTTRDEDYLDAFSPSGFLKLIENHGTNTQGWPLLQEKIDGRLDVELMLHQIHGVCWMHQMEQIKGGLNSLLWERRSFPEGGTYYYSPVLGQARLQLSQNDTDGAAASGGLLVDEMGLGKTVQIIALILSTLEDLANSRREDKDYWHATLIIVPPALVSQWISEVQKIAGNSLVVDFFCHRTAEFFRQQSTEETSSNSDGQRTRRADVVITTYQSLENSNRRSSKAIQVLSGHTWGRVVLDEMQEIRSWTTTISKGCQKLRSSRRWMLSGTPITHSIDDFRGELCFLNIEPFAASNDDGFWNFAVSNHWENRSRYALEILRILSLIMLRRSKSMSIRDTQMPLLGLKPLEIIYEPVPQDTSERALYCFTEFLMHASMGASKNARIANLGDDDNDEGGGVVALTKKEIRTKGSFLRILNELCVSPFLLNGGLGCTSQLGQFNNLNKDYNRLHPSESQSAPTRQGDYSCDDAISYLSQVEDFARTDDDFVTDVTMGGGDGVSRRNRALNSPEFILGGKKKDLNVAKLELNKARSKRARARWHLALEKITTGELPADCLVGINEGIAQTWRWRADANRLAEASETPSLLNRAWRSWRATGIIPTIPALLTRGWRPTPKFFGANTDPDDNMDKKTCLLERLYNKVDGTRFLWAHPHALLLDGIPEQMSENHIRSGFLAVQEDKNFDGDTEMRIYPLKVPSVPMWKAFVHIENKSFFDLVWNQSKSAEGIELACENPPDWVRNKIAAAEEELEEATAENTVHPCGMTLVKLNKAREELRLARLGLCVQQPHSKRFRAGNIVCHRGFTSSLRLSAPETSKELIKSASKICDESTDKIGQKNGEIRRMQADVSRLEKRINSKVSNRLGSLNTFEKLQKLKEGQQDEDITCPICLDDLGKGGDSDGKIALTRCGHMSCHGCLRKWLDQQYGGVRACGECRKPIKTGDVIRVDPKLANEDDERDAKRQTAAKSLIRRAAEMLEANHGKLDPKLWHALYYSVDLPHHADQSRSMSCTAIPGHFLAHLRHSTGLPLNPGRYQGESTAKLPSKIRALLDDLPKDELSVVFASSKSVVCHVMAVLEKKGYGCRGLFAGQTEKDSEVAVSEWQSNFPQVLVLVVQAGRAACGLTLTAARKMFLLEPFRSHEEEKQAYARLHRYGQRDAVRCKIYYTPVSVESRLLEWRRRATSHAADAPSAVYAELRDIHSEQEDSDTASETEDNEGKSGDDGEQNQLNFLLGLDSASG